jgi:hypothetical protein
MCRPMRAAQQQRLRTAQGGPAAGQQGPAAGHQAQASQQQPLAITRSRSVLGGGAAVQRCRRRSEAAAALGLTWVTIGRLGRHCLAGHSAGPRHARALPRGCAAAAPWLTARGATTAVQRRDLASAMAGRGRLTATGRGGGSHGRRLTMPLLLVTNAVDAADLALLPGLFRVLEQDFRVGPKALSMLVLAQSTLKGLAYPVWGVAADRYPRRRSLWLATAAWGAAAAVVAASVHFAMILLSLGLGGIALACLMPVSQSMMADIIPAARRGTAFGWFALAGNLGGLVGGALSTTTSEMLLLGGAVRGWRL